MLSVRRLVTSMRFRLGDMQGAQYSDYELIEAINRAASLLFARMGARFVWAAAKKTVLVVDEEAGSALLPRDFHSMRRVTREDGKDTTPSMYSPCSYRVVGSEFYAAPGAYGMEYYYIPRPVFTPEDELDAPEAVSPYLETAALAIFNNAPNGAAQICEECCEALAGGEVSRFPEFGPVEILGGKL